MALRVVKCPDKSAIAFLWIISKKQTEARDILAMNLIPTLMAIMVPMMKEFSRKLELCNLFLV